MNRAAAVVILATLVACGESTPPEEQQDQELASAISADGFDPNSDLNSGRTAAPPPATCSYNATTKWHTCGPTTHNGITMTRQFQFLDGDGNAQQRPDSNTRSQKAKSIMAGTLSPQPPAPAGTVQFTRNSEETVTGLGPGSTERTVNGTANGTELHKFTDNRGAHEVQRIYADSTQNIRLTVPFDPAAPWPTSGTIVRNASINATVNGVKNSHTMREERIHAAGGKLTVKTTINGQTRTCVFQLTLPPKPGDAPAPPPKPVCS